MRALPLTLALGLAAAALTGCGGATSSASDAAEEDRLDVLAGFYPYAFVAERVGGADVTVTNLTGPGVEAHDLELTPQQVAAVSQADLVLYAAGFQPAVDEAVEQQAAQRGFDVLSAVELRAGTGDPHAEEEGHDDEHAGEGDPHGDESDAHAEEDAHAGESDAHAGEGDPHVWLDPVRLAAIGDAVAEELAERAPDRAEAFRERAQGLRSELEALDDELRQGLSDCARNEIVTSHDAFGYLAAAYGLEQVSLAGLSPEDEASPKRLAEVARFAEEHDVTTIFFEELVSPKVAQSLAAEVGARAEELSPLENEPESGDYLTAMRENLSALRSALGCP